MTRFETLDALKCDRTPVGRDDEASTLTWAEKCFAASGHPRCCLAGPDYQRRPFPGQQSTHRRSGNDPLTIVTQVGTNEGGRIDGPYRRFEDADEILPRLVHLNKGRGSHGQAFSSSTSVEPSRR